VQRAVNSPKRSPPANGDFHLQHHPFSVRGISLLKWVHEMAATLPARSFHMKSKLLHDENGLKTFAVVFDKNDAVTDPLLAFANEHGLSAAQVSAIGAFSEVTLGYFDPQKKTYARIPVTEQVEVLSFLGNLTREDGKCKLHAHVVVGKSNGTAHGGHFLEGKVWPTLEMVISETPQHLRRVRDEDTGLALIDLAA
jgi:predicted DNA-binding protein with PD1-like motif